MQKVNLLEQHVSKYWLLSSFWNGRVEMEGRTPSASTFIRRLQTNLSMVVGFNRLANLYCRLIDEVIYYGQKRLPEDPKDNVVVLKRDIVVIDSLSALGQELLERIVGEAQAEQQ